MGSKRQSHVAGEKFGKHTSTSRIGKKLAQTADGMDAVTRVALCALRHQGKRGVKLLQAHQTQNGLRINIKSEGTIQDIHIVTDSPDMVFSVLADKFSNLQRVS